MRLFFNIASIKKTKTPPESPSEFQEKLLKWKSGFLCNSKSEREEGVEDVSAFYSF